MPNERTLYQKKRKPPRKQVPRLAEEPSPVPAPVSCAVRCPECRGEAKWSTACTVVHRPIDPGSLKRSRAVVLPFTAESSLVVHFPSIVAPEEYSGVENITSVYNLYRLNGFDSNLVGVRSCDRCATLQRAKLNWPRSAYFRVLIKGELLYAKDRSEWSLLRTFIESKNRRELRRKNDVSWFTRYLPRGVLAAKNRAAALRAIDRIITKKK